MKGRGRSFSQTAVIMSRKAFVHCKRGVGRGKEGGKEGGRERRREVAMRGPRGDGSNPGGYGRQAKSLKEPWRGGRESSRPTEAALGKQKQR